MSEAEILPKKTGRPKGKKTNGILTEDKRKTRILELAAGNLPASEIAKVVSMPETSVRRHIAKFKEWFKQLEHVDDFIEAKSDLLKAAQLHMLKNGLSDSKTKKASMLACIQAFEILNKAERLETGKSTENFAHNIFGKIDLSGKRD